MNYGTKQGHFLGYWNVILVILGSWAYGNFYDDNNIFHKMKNDLTTGTWQDNIQCPINITLLCTSDAVCLFGIPKNVLLHSIKIRILTVFLWIKGWANFEPTTPVHKHASRWDASKWIGDPYAETTASLSNLKFNLSRSCRFRVPLPYVGPLSNIWCGEKAGDKTMTEIVHW
jgi:hypothetical protein